MRVELSIPKVGTPVTYERYDATNGYYMEVYNGLTGEVLGHIRGLHSKAECRAMMRTFMDTFGLRGLTEDEYENLYAIWKAEDKENSNVDS